MTIFGTSTTTDRSASTTSANDRNISAHPAANRPSQSVNVNSVERIGSTLMGGTLVMMSLFGRRRPFSTATMALVGCNLLYRGINGSSAVYRALGVNTATQDEREPEVQRTVTVARSPEELYRIWREPQTLSRVMGDIAEVRQTGHDTHHWKLRTPTGQTLEWDARIAEERPGEVVRWKSVEGADLPNEWSVRFRPAPGNWGTEVTLHLRFTEPTGVLASVAAKLFPIVTKATADKVLRRFKSLAETGEIPGREHTRAARSTAH